MSHPERSELTGYAIGDIAHARVEPHVVSCPECAAEVARLRSSLGALLAHVTVPSGAGPDCLDEHAVAAFVEGDQLPAERDARSAHLVACARCRAVVSSIAHARLEKGVAAELAPLEGTRTRRLGYALGLAAVATVAGLVVVSQRPPENGSLAHRAETSAEAPAPRTISPAGSTRVPGVLRWHAVRGASQYRVTLFDHMGVVLYETALADTVAVLPEHLRLEAGRAYHWLVAARTDYDRWNTSALVAFSVEGVGR
jgi:hypothetical protein